MSHHEEARGTGLCQRSFLSLWLIHIRAHWDIISKTVLFQLLSVWFVNKTSDIREHSSPPAQFTSHVGKWCLGAADGSLQASRWKL